MAVINEKYTVGKIRQGDRSAFSLVFVSYYTDLVMFAFTIVKTKDASEEIVQEVFVRLWDNRETIEIRSSLKSFLLKSVQNKCIDWLRHQKIKDRYAEKRLQDNTLYENETESYLMYSELEQSIEKALMSMPEKISQTYSMNRFDGLTYREIADRLDVSVRTVEVRVSKALDFLREKLKDFFPVLLLINAFWKFLA